MRIGSGPAQPSAAIQRGIGRLDGGQMNQGVKQHRSVSDAELCKQFLLQSKSAVICGNSYAHTITFLLGQFDAWLACIDHKF